jgi:hypothetical protein
MKLKIMLKEKAITYSLLAHIRNNGELARGPIDIFIPLVKLALSEMNKRGIHQGKSLLEIKTITDELYSINFPIPVLNKILQVISKEINTNEKSSLILYRDGAFSIDKYTFTELQNSLEAHQNIIDEIEGLFEEFCHTSDLEIEDSQSIFQFIEKNKYNLSKYLSNSSLLQNKDFTAEAQFIKFFKKIPPIYEKIKNIYLGSIISSYIDYDAKDPSNQIELLFDTNFILGLIDLNTPESTHTCRTLLEIGKNQNFKLRVLKATLEETDNLLRMKSKYFDKSFLQKKVNPEDVYNACERRNLNKIDLERIADNLEKEIGSYGISVIQVKDKLKNKAKITDDYHNLVKARGSKEAAIHDAIALLHIKNTRGKKVRDFDQVNSWFVNNSKKSVGYYYLQKEGYQPETIKVDDLLNILWLSNPNINSQIESEDLAEIGLTSMLSMTLNSNLPKAQILKELDDNIQKYAFEEISDSDIIRIATRITNKQLKDIESLNELAEKDKEEFVKRLESEAQKQRKLEEVRIEKLENLFKDLADKTNELKGIKGLYEKRLAETESIEEVKDQLLKEKNKYRKIAREEWIERKVKEWRFKSWRFLIAFGVFCSIGIFYTFYHSGWSLENSFELIKDLSSNIIISSIISIVLFFFTFFTLFSLRNKYYNYSNIKSFKEQLKVPNEFKELI